MNAGKSKVMVGSSDGKIIVNSGKWPCAYGKGVQANIVKCTVCKKWIHNMTTAIQTFDANQHSLQNFQLVQYLFQPQCKPFVGGGSRLFDPLESRILCGILSAASYQNL